MDIKELRIGNIVKIDDEYLGPIEGKVISVNESGVVTIKLFDEEKIGRYFNCGTEDIYPIPITEELLLKIGFKKENEYIAVKPNKSCLVHFPNHFITGGYFVIAIARLPGMPSTTPVKHLHQLQNAYYLLTGEELKIKP